MLYGVLLDERGMRWDDTNDSTWDRRAGTRTVCVCILCTQHDMTGWERAELGGVYRQGHCSAFGMGCFLGLVFFGRGGAGERGEILWFLKEGR